MRVCHHGNIVQPLHGDLHRHIAIEKPITGANERSRNRLTEELPCIAASSHFTRENTMCRAPASAATLVDTFGLATWRCRSQRRILTLMSFLSKFLLYKQSFKIVPRSGFGASLPGAVARSSMVVCKSVSADRRAMAASRFLVAAAACGIL